MAEETKPQLTEEEKIEKRARLFKLISRILIVVSVIVIAVFIFFVYGTRQNISQQTSIDTQELRSKLKQIISLERRYYEENGKYISFKYLQICKEIPQFNPAIDGYFKYQFDAKTGIVTGREKDASNDVNGDVDGNDGLTLSVDWEHDVVKGSKGGNFFWTDEDKADFESRTGKTE